VVVLGTLVISLYVMLMAVKVTVAEKGETLLRPGMWAGYLACILAHLRAVCETIILVPLLGACFEQF
jgi:hypothetical protein